ncbi:MAG: dephospho-CoA kinase [Deltaproteobacteria bacterium RIFCSPLOWO2_12_FULL_60_19]|nr:MAG: dephospho-CoA kinase [Deltaproteobacteria bacterium RIFCSPLOWO2_12_FULL_60_19]
MKLIGLTGGIASGKTTVAAMLRELGASIINADELAREIVRPGQDAWKEIVAAFGEAVLRDDRTIDRQKLRNLAFKNDLLRKRLESITHPRIRALAKVKAAQFAAQGAEVVVYEAPLFFEANAQVWIRPVILVACDVAVQRQRLRDRDNLTTHEIDRHLAAQMPAGEKRKLADFVIENNGDLDDLRRRVKDVWDKIAGSQQ